MTAPARIALFAVLLGAAWPAAPGQSGVVLDVPFVKQETNACGPASVAMVMQYWIAQRGGDGNGAADAEQIARAVGASGGHAALASSLTRYLAAHGFRAFAFSGDWNALRAHLEKGRPLIVAVRPAGGSRLHYLVVAGFDGGDVLLNDPARRKLAREHRDDFEKEWSATTNWTLLAVPQDGAR